MTRKSWTTDAQLAWLQERKGAFLQALQSKTSSKDFFPKIVQDFRQKWPVDDATDQEIASAKSLERANKIKRDKYDRVGFSNAKKKPDAH
jgi:hypothetical protein